jgi:hypothetical protein
MSVEQSDLITCLLLDQLVKLESSEGELSPVVSAYADFLLQVKSGQPADLRFFKELEALREIIKEDQKYVTIIDTIIALWNG